MKFVSKTSLLKIWGEVNQSGSRTAGSLGVEEALSICCLSVEGKRDKKMPKMHPTNFHHLPKTWLHCMSVHLSLDREWIVWIAAFDKYRGSRVLKKLSSVSFTHIWAQCPTAQCAASLFDFAAFGERESTSSGSRAVGKRSSAGESPLVVQVFDRGGVVVIVLVEWWCWSKCLFVCSDRWVNRRWQQRELEMHLFFQTQTFKRWLGRCIWILRRVFKAANYLKYPAGCLEQVLNRPGKPPFQCGQTNWSATRESRSNLSCF